ncbi:hypothetical protein LMG26411_07232 [Cupriavidus numazuensis]|uniref:Uncharacterized protein n=1 Tax=Cupriavidus numazuensis TaxID=221992 RepID=A0ABM8TU96_9BURK|nr:hypothetical protein LMG26411_07232 [Cupriavidus numazuensis]
MPRRVRRRGWRASHAAPWAVVPLPTCANVPSCRTHRRTARHSARWPPNRRRLAVTSSISVAASGSSSSATSGVKRSNASAAACSSSPSATGSRSSCTTSADSACTPPRRMPKHTPSAMAGVLARITRSRSITATGTAWCSVPMAEDAGEEVAGTSSGQFGCSASSDRRGRCTAIQYDMGGTSRNNRYR